MAKEILLWSDRISSPHDGERDMIWMRERWRRDREREGERGRERERERGREEERERGEGETEFNDERQHNRGIKKLFIFCPAGERG